MPTTWGNIKTLLSAMSPQAMQSGYVEGNSGVPPELTLYARASNSEIAGNPHKFSWLMREYNLTLTGATSYNLTTLVPDLMQIYQIAGDTLSNKEMPYQSPREFTMDVGGIKFTIKGRTLVFSGASPTTGTLTIPYYSNYLVLDEDGVTRKKDFENDDDILVIPDDHFMVLVEGIMRFVYRKEALGKKDAQQYVKKVYLWDGRLAEIDPFLHLLTQAVLADNIVASPIYDFRFNLI